MKKEFTRIYDKELWGKGKGSGSGSSLFANKKYIPFLESFLKNNNIFTINTSRFVTNINLFSIKISSRFMINYFTY